MSGNVWEWIDKSSGSSDHFIGGGGYDDDGYAVNCSIGWSEHTSSGDTNSDLGFRCCISF